MAGLMDLLNSEIGKTLVQGASSEVNAPEDKTASVINMAMPLLLGAMKKNASSEEGASSLLSALKGGKHDGSILNNLGSILGGGVDQDVVNDGSNILGHVFGNKQSTVEQTLSAKSGLDMNQIAKILKIAAPVLLGMLGNQAKSGDIDSKSGLNTLLGSMLGGQPKSNQSLIESLIDQDGDGSVLDDVAGMVLGRNKKGNDSDGGIGGMLGGLFK
ncbi:MAG: DUF937 domain-containing protein [Leeuwenhoekiella sp.]